MEPVKKHSKYDDGTIINPGEKPDEFYT